MELCGRHINVGRPKGYVEPPAGATASNMGAAKMFAASITSAATRVLLLQNMMKALNMWDEQERRDVSAVAGPASCRVTHVVVQGLLTSCLAACQAVLLRSRHLAALGCIPPPLLPQPFKALPI